MKKSIIIIIAVILVIAVSGYFYVQKTKKPSYNPIIAHRGTVVQEVSVTGNVKPAENLALAFEETGRIAKIYVQVNDSVKKDKILASLDNAEISAQLNQAKAKLKSAQADLEQYQAAYDAQKAKLDELNKGTRPEEIKIQEVKVSNAQSAVEDAKKNLLDKLQDAYTKSDDAVRNKADQIFNNPRSFSPQLSPYLIVDTQLKTDTEQQRIVVENLLNTWKISLDQLSINSNLDNYLNTAKNNLDQIKSFLDKTALVVNSASANVNLTQTTLNTWKSDISTGRTNVNTAIANLSAADEKLTTAKSDLTLEENELLLDQAG